jgi:N-acetylmuramic acid 6-phosphate etherase
MNEARQTESLLPGLEGFDTWSDARILGALLDGQRRALDATENALAQIAAAAASIAAAVAAGGRIIFAGAGASARIAVQEGAELPATVGIDERRILYFIAGGRAAIFDTLAEQEDNIEAGQRDAAVCQPGDVLVAVAASGSTPYTCAAAREAKARGAAIIAVVNNRHSPLGRVADVEVVAVSGPEVIAGSTRLGAGTAQKAALNLMFCLAFTRLGAVHDGLMVDVAAGNAKLRDRSRSIVMRLTGADVDHAGVSLAAADWQIKPAVLMLKGAANAAVARDLLAASYGNLRGALARLQASC